MLRTHSLLPFLETPKSFNFYCNKEHELISPDRLLMGFRRIHCQRVTYNMHWLPYPGGLRRRLILDCLIRLQDKSDSIQLDF